MKLRFFVLLSIMVLGGYGMAGAQSLSLDHTDGLLDADRLDTGVPVTFYIRITGDGDSHSGITNGFQVYSDDGAVWNPLVGDTTGTLGKAQFDGGFFISYFSATGTGADTVGFGGFRFFSPGLVAGFDDVVYTLDIGPIAESEIGKTICLDSTFYPPAGVWKWAGPDVLPDWSGPHCFTIGPLTCDVVVTSPAGGETWESGTPQTITYETTDCSNCDNVDISYSVDGGGWIGISTGSTNTGTFSWTVPDVESSNVVVRVCCSGTADCGESNPFTIESAPPEIVSVDPNSAAQCDEGLVVTITGANTDWQPSGGSGTTTVFLTHGSGSPTINASSFVVNSPTQVQAIFDFAYDAPTGLYDVTVDSWSAPADVLEDGFTVIVATPSDITLDPMTLTFDALQFGPNPDDQSFSITSVSCRHDFTVSDDADWLTLSIADGTTPADVIVSIDITGLTPSVYNATITVDAPLATNNPQMVDVTLTVAEAPEPGGPLMSAAVTAAAASGPEDALTRFGLDSNATDGYDAGIDEFEAPIPPGDYVRTYFSHPEWNQMQDEFNSDIRFPFGTLCKDFVLTVETNLSEMITLSLGSVLNEGCYSVSLYDDQDMLLVSNFLAEGYSFMAAGGSTDFIIRVCAGEGSMPVIACPEENLLAFICGPGPVCVPLVITNYDDVTVDGGGTWAEGSLCFNAEAAGTYNFHVVASNICGVDECDVVVEVTMGSEPVIDCPQTDLTAERCGPGQVCVPLAITGAETVTAGDATWADGQLCFDVVGSDGYGFQVIAVNDCGEDTCDVLVNVTINDVPMIDCPPDTIRVTQTDELVCVDLDIQGADSVAVIHEQAFTYANGQLCFFASTLGTYDATLIAMNECGADTCNVVVVVSDCPLPVIECPAEPLNVEQCALGSIQIPMAISGHDGWWVSPPSFWADGILTVVPSVFGELQVTVRAGNDCGTTDCDVIVNFTEIPAVAIECPVDPLFYILCAPEEICIDVPIINADEVLVDGDATWADGQFCFTAEPGTDYSFTITASNACGEVTCVVEFFVDSFDDPVACFTADPTEGTVPLEVTFDTECTYVDAAPGTFLWDFGDGTSSTDAKPVHIFETIGCFDVSLTVTDDCGRTDMTMQTICVLDDQIVTPTDQWINIYCPEPMLEGVPLNPGDYITAYDPDGILCGMGQVEPDGSYGMIPIYADDIYTADIDEGAIAGDLITLKINGVAVASDPALFWTENGAVFEVCSFTAEECVTFDLDAGWHLISWSVAYTGAVEEAIADFAECVDVVLSFDQGGLTYDPTLPEFSTLATVDFYHGYWLRLSCPVTFDICGGIISPNDYIEVYSGWNLVSYWPDDILPVEDALASLLDTDNLLVAYGYDGGAMDYIPDDPMYQSLTHLAPGFGYWVKTRWDAMLTYPGFMPPVAAPRMDNQRPLAASSGVTPSRSWMSIYGSELEIDGQPVRSGATVEVFTNHGVLCGSGVYNDGILKFTSVYGYDAENDSYPKDGDLLSVRIDGERVASDLTYAGSGSRISLSSLSAADLLPDSYSMSQNYPNPFNPSTTISFNLPNAGQVQLSIFNVLGQKVTTLVDGQYTAGTHEATWNGTDESGSPVGSGIYFYRITSSDFDQTKKMILMK